MVIESVTIVSFGPFTDRTLELSPGLNVVTGRNESGKSTWHSAIYAALCGVPSGLSRSEDRDFAERHRPWDQPGWAMRARVRTEDGRRIELFQDLAGDAPSYVKDLDSEADITEELMFEGAPDGSRLLGFNRRTFRSAACVNQAAVLALLKEPAVLHEMLRRSAATGGADSSAALARDRLDGVAAEVETALLVERERRPMLETELQDARTALAEYWELEATVGDLRQRDVALSRDLLVLEAAVAMRVSEDSEKRVARMRELLTRFPDRPEGDPALDEEIAHEVGITIRAYEDRPDPPRVKGPTVAELELELENLPEVAVEGDVEPDSSVLAAREAYDEAKRALDHNWTRRPPEPEPLAASASEEALRNLADQLDSDPADSNGGDPGGGWTVGRLLGRGPRNARDSAAHEAGLLGLPPSPVALRAAADQVGRALEMRQDLQRWAARQQELRGEVAGREEALWQALAARGVTADGNLVDALFGYVKDCSERAQVARAEARRQELQGMIQARREMDEAAEQALKTREQAEAGLRDMAARCGVEGSVDLALLAGLQEWLGRHREEREHRRQAYEAWTELDALVGDSSVPEIEAAAQQQRTRALEYAAQVDTELLEPVDLSGDTEARLNELRHTAEEAARELHLAEGRLDRQRRGLEEVADLEEELAASDSRAARLREVGTAVTTAHDHIAMAQERIHRSVAPLLAEAIRRWLPRITEGRYVDVWVQPDTLQVDVCGADRFWRQAAILSQGTAEQIYLLLRLAMIEHLTEPSERAPALFDDVTVLSDTPRTLALLDLLHEVSRQRQVVLFSQEDEVKAWAQRSLTDGRDRLHDLGAPGVPAAQEMASPLWLG